MIRETTMVARKFTFLAFMYSIYRFMKIFSFSRTWTKRMSVYSATRHVDFSINVSYLYKYV